MKKYEMMFIVKSTVEENVASATVENIKNIARITPKILLDT